MMSVQMQAAVSRVSLNGDDQSPVAAIRISSNQTLSVCRRHDGGAALQLTTETPRGPKSFSTQVPLLALPQLITALCEIEQDAVDRGDLPDPCGEDADDGAP